MATPHESYETVWNGEWGWRKIYKSPFTLWSSRVTDQDLPMFDPWAFAHAFVGGLQFAFVPFVWNQPYYIDGRWFAFNVGTHVVFEVVENSPCGIYRLRAYFPLSLGDTVLNSIGDLLAFCAGYLLAGVAWVASQGEIGWVVFVLAILCVLSVVPFVAFRSYIRIHSSATHTKSQEQPSSNMPLLLMTSNA